MKQSISILFGVLMCATLCSFMACGNKTQTGGNVDSDSVSFDKDTIAVETQMDSMSNKNVDVSVTISLPVGDGVAQKIRETLVSLMGKQIYKDADFRGDGNIKGEAFTGNANDVKAMCTFYCKNIFKGVNKEFDDDVADNIHYGDSSLIAPGHDVYCQNMNLMKVSEANNYIVFNDQAISFRGGSHIGGETIDHFIIFNRTTGEQVKDIIKPSSAKQMQSLIIDGFKAYFKECGSDDSEDSPIGTDEDVHTMLGLDGSDIIPLPKGCTIMPTADGLMVSYAQEEIGSFAVGHPVFIIPYSKAKPFMTTEAIELLK